MIGAGSITSIHTKYAGHGIHPSCEIQGRHHQNS